MLINIVTNLKIVQQIKFSKYFQVNLGFVSTIDKGGRRIYNESDNFSNYYNSTYRTTIYAQGNIGNIRFYVDHYITSEDYLVIYYGDTFEEFIVNFDFIQLNKKGIDSYLGSIIKEIDEEYEELKNTKKLKELEVKPKGDSSKISQTPGQVTWDDIKVYMEKKRSSGN